MKKDKKKQKRKKDLNVNKLGSKNNNNKQTTRTTKKRTSRRLRGSRRPASKEKPDLTAAIQSKQNKEYFEKINHKYKDNLNFKP